MLILNILFADKQEKAWTEHVTSVGAKTELFKIRHGEQKLKLAKQKL